MTNQHRKILIGIIVLAVLLRLGAALYFGNEIAGLPGTADQISYHELAKRVLQGHGFSFGETWWPITEPDAPTAHWSFLYTFYLVGVYKLFGVHPLAARLIQAVLVGIMHPYLAWQLGRLTFGRRIGLIAAGLTAVYTYFVYYAATLMTEPFYFTTILLSLYLTIRLARAPSREEGRLAVGLGLALGTTILLRQLFMIVAPLLLLWLWLARRRQQGVWPLRPTAVALTITALMVIPFTLYNYLRFDQFVLLNTNAGYAFFWGNHPVYGDDFEPILPPEMGSYQSLIPAELQGLDEAMLERELLQRGIGFIVDDPIRYVRLSLSRIPDYFMFWPSPESGRLSNVARLVSFGIMWPFMLLGLLYTFLRSPDGGRGHFSSPASLLLLFMVVYAALHVLTWTLIRYRLPVDAVALVFAAQALALLFVRFRARVFRIPTVAQRKSLVQ